MKLLVVDVAALGYRLWERYSRAEFWKGLGPRPAETVFPALTCPVQASFRTALPPSEHGMVANGFYSRELRRTLFWEQSSSLYSGARIWDGLRNTHGRVGQICWQNSLGSDSDLILSPTPVHKHHGGMIQAFYSCPDRLYDDVCSEIGCKFNLFSYWGPFTSSKSSRWICDATCEVLKSALAPELLLAYIPHLDYDLQRHGPESAKAAKAFGEVELMIEKLLSAAKSAGYEFLIFGDYAITPAESAVLPNKILRENGFYPSRGKGYFYTRTVNGMLYPDLWSSRAFAMVDHQVAHVYIENPGDIEDIRNLFSKTKGVKAVHDHAKIDHRNAGDLILEAEPGYWFAYRWWDKDSEAPDYARHVDIHSKPGFDPCELFMSLWPPMSVSLDTSKIRGTHGSGTGGEDAVFCGSSIDVGEAGTIIGISEKVRKLLSGVMEKVKNT